MPDTTPPWARTADAAHLDADALAYRQRLSKELFKLHASSVPPGHSIRRDYLAGTWREPADQVRSYLAARILKRYGTARELTRDANAWDLLADAGPPVAPRQALASVAKLIDRTSRAPSKEDLRRVAQWLYGEVWDDMNPMLDHEIERYGRDDNENRLVVIPTRSSLWRVLARPFC